MLKVNGGDKLAIRSIVDKLHVATSQADVEADIRARAAKSTMAAPSQYVDACVAYALKVHDENGVLYLKVMRGF